MALADDNSARAFGKAMIRDMMRGDSTYTIRAGRWTSPSARARFAVFPSHRNDPDSDA
jgi:hypothetical protein